MTEEAGNASYRVALPEFEGPLDLLLHLCKTNEIDVVNLPVAFITQKYLEYLDVMKSLSVDVAADYLVMAATLAYLKARELVPTPEPLPAEDEEGGEILDPREELIRRLLEYRKYKDAAEQLGERPIEGKNVFGRGMPIETEGPASPLPFAEHSVWKLIEAFGKLLEKAGPKITHEVMFDRVSISARINQVIDRLEVGSGSFRFDALFDLNLPEHELRSQLVVTLLAILELARLKVVRVVASEDQETLFIAQVHGAALADARRVHVTSDAEGLQAAAEEEEAAESGDEPTAPELRAETPGTETAGPPTEEAPLEEVRVESGEAPLEEVRVASGEARLEEVRVQSGEAPLEEVRVESEEAPPEEVRVESEEAPPDQVRMESHKEPHEEA